MTRTNKHSIRPAFDDLEGRQLLSVTLPETSIAAPAIITFQGAPYIAWTGTDTPRGQPQHHLNIENLYTGTKVTLPDTSSAAPALAVFQGSLYLAWTGTDAQHHLNVESSADGLNFGNKTVFDGTMLSNGINATTLYSDGPALAVDPIHDRLVIAWTGTDLRINYTSSEDVSWNPALTLSEYSFFSPSLNTNNGDLTVSWTDLDKSEVMSYSITFGRLATVPIVMVSQNAPSVATDDGFPGASYVGYAWTDSTYRGVYVYSREFGKIGPVGSSPYGPSLAVDYLPDNNHFYIAWTGLDGYLHYQTL